MTARGFALNALVATILAFVMVPILIILPMGFSEASYLGFPPKGFSLRWFSAFFGDRRWMAATSLSVTIALLVAMTTATLGTMAAYAMVRRGGRLASLLQAIVALPIIVPHIALAVALYLFFQRIGLTGTIWAYVLAHSVIAMPFTVFTLTAALAKIDPALESAAMVCGASRLNAFRLVTLPSIAPSVLSAALFAFIISFDEPVITYFLAGARDKTLPRLMFEDIQMNLTPMLAAIAVLLMGLSVLVLLAGALLRHLARSRSLERA